ncbi:MULTISPECIES: hypothetical protein [unclassified Streptomyces]|uniref:hypothetical protein n=1 Tax=unclassified Streptomyces TaxID=2593676 RepID=UPI00386CBBCD
MCACGTTKPLYEADADLAGPLTDRNSHLSVVRDAAVPLAAVLVEMAGQLTGTAADAPLAALRAPPVLELVADTYRDHGA